MTLSEIMKNIQAFVKKTKYRFISNCSFLSISFEEVKKTSKAVGGEIQTKN